CNPEPAALARREPPEAFVPPELISVFVDDRSLGGRQTLRPEEVAVVTAREKARFLTFAAARDGEARALGFRTRLLLRLLAQREHDPVELCGIEPSEHVRLVFCSVDRPREQAPSALLDRARVVTGGELRGAGAAGEREQLGEAER